MEQKPGPGRQWLREHTPPDWPVRDVVVPREVFVRYAEEYGTDEPPLWFRQYRVWPA